MAIPGLGQLVDLGLQAAPVLTEAPSFLSQIGTGLADAGSAIGDFGADALSGINNVFGTTAVSAAGLPVTSGGLGNLANIGLQGFGAYQGYQNSQAANERADAQLAQQQTAFDSNQADKDKAANLVF